MDILFVLLMVKVLDIRLYDFYSVTSSAAEGIKVAKVI